MTKMKKSKQSLFATALFMILFTILTISKLMNGQIALGILFGAVTILYIAVSVTDFLPLKSRR